MPRPIPLIAVTVSVRSRWKSRRPRWTTGPQAAGASRAVAPGRLPADRPGTDRSRPRSPRRKAPVATARTVEGTS